MSDQITRRCVEVGDDDEGQPRLIIHTTREQLTGLGRNVVYADVVVTIAPDDQAQTPACASRLAGRPPI